MLRRSLQESMRRMSALASEGSAQVDRRIVVKLLTTYFEKGHSAEVLQVMARMLSFTGGCLCDAPTLELLPVSVCSLASFWRASLSRLWVPAPQGKSGTLLASVNATALALDLQLTYVDAVPERPVADSCQSCLRQAASAPSQ